MFKQYFNSQYVWFDRQINSDSGGAKWFKGVNLAQGVWLRSQTGPTSLNTAKLFYLIFNQVVENYTCLFNLRGFFKHLRLCLATAIHNLKWLKIIHINWGQTSTNLDI